MTITLTPTLRAALSGTMIALAITSTGLAALLAVGAFTTYAATLGAGVAMGALLGSNLTLVWVSVIERRTHRLRHDQQSAPRLDSVSCPRDCERRSVRCIQVIPRRGVSKPRATTARRDRCGEQKRVRAVTARRPPQLVGQRTQPAPTP